MTRSSGYTVGMAVFCTGLRWPAGYLGLTLVFMWGGAQQEKFNLCFSRVFSFILASGLGTMGFRHFPDIS